MATANNLVVKISAVDATSAAIDAVSKRLSGITKGGGEVTKSLARLSDATGVTRLSEAMQHLGGSAARTGEQLMGAAGGFGSMIAALSVGGVAKMTSDWAKATQALSFDSTRIGANVSELHALEGAAKLAGSSAGAMSGGLRGLQDTMVDIVGGRNNEALVYFHRLGVAFDDGKGHALRATAVFPKLAEALSKIPDPSIRARVGTLLLGGAYEELAPVVAMGEAGIAKLTATSASYGVQTADSIAKAETFRGSQERLKQAFDGLGNSISEKVSPELVKLMDPMARWIAQNREMIALDVSGWAKDYSKVFRILGGAIDTAVTSTVGWNTALEIGIPLIASRAIPPLARLENAMAKLALVQIPTWLGTALGIGAGGVAALGTPLLLSGDTPSNPLLNVPPSGPGFFGQGGTLEQWIRSFGGGDTSAKRVELDATKRGFLDTIAAPESGGRYDIKNGWSPTNDNAGTRFRDYSKFPEGVAPGGTSTAAGRYQFISGTWKSVAKSMGLPDFSPENQDQGAWHLADTAYHKKTGRDLDSDLRAGNRQAEIASALGSIWPSLPGGSQSHQSQDTFDRSLSANTASEQLSTRERPPSLLDTELRTRLDIAARDAREDAHPSAPLLDDGLRSRLENAGKVEVHVRLSGLPPGATATTTTTSGDAAAGVKIARAMPQ